LLGTFPQSIRPSCSSRTMPQTATSAKTPKEPPDSAPAQATTHTRPRTAGRHHVDQTPMRPPVQRPHVPALLQGGPDQRTTPTRGAVSGTASPHPCRCPGSCRAPTPHPRTPHAGTARTHTSRHVPSRSPETSLFSYGSRARATLAIRSMPVHMAWDREAQPSTP
jgi:hypothetical protein